MSAVIPRVSFTIALTNARGRNTQGKVEAIDTDPRGANEFLKQNLAGMNRSGYGLFGHNPFTSVMIDNLYFTGVSRRPHKAQSVLDGDPYSVLASAVASERFQGTADTSQVAEDVRGVKHRRFSESDALDGAERPAALFMEGLFSFRATWIRELASHMSNALP